MKYADSYKPTVEDLEKATKHHSLQVCRQGLCRLHYAGLQAINGCSHLQDSRRDGPRTAESPATKGRTSEGV